MNRKTVDFTPENRDFRSNQWKHIIGAGKQAHNLLVIHQRALRALGLIFNAHPDNASTLIIFVALESR